MCVCVGGGGGGCGGGREKDEVLSTIGTGNIVRDGLWDELCRSDSLMSCLDYFGRVGGLDCLGEGGGEWATFQGGEGAVTFGSVFYIGPRHCSLACIDCLVGVGRRGQGEGGSLPIGIGYFCVLVVYMSGSL